MKRRIITLGLAGLLLVGAILFYFLQVEEVSYTDTKMNVVLSLEDTIDNDSVWCGTFNLIWNDLKNDLAKQDIVFNPQLKIVENLNKGTFNTKYLSEDVYYKVYGYPDLKLKKEIEQAIKDKFNETSDILDDFIWEDRNEKDYFLYAMLKKEFKFNKMFTELEKGTFKEIKDVEYFGINGTTDDKVRDQVEVLYYKDQNDFAIKLITKGNDEVIIAKGNNDNNFKAAYNNVIKTSLNYNLKKFGNDDILQIPNIAFKLKKEFTELENKGFKFANGNEYVIDTALQTIEFELDKEGGKVKSEAGISINKSSATGDEPRSFIVNDTFMIFLQEKNKTLPYFAAKISSIDLVQDIK